eukprot:COSAG04_NODE_118_length_25039_cov_11.342783_15_plen_225_part_00
MVKPSPLYFTQCWLSLAAAVAGGGEEGDGCASHAGCKDAHYCTNKGECSSCEDEDGESPCELWNDSLDGSCGPCGGSEGSSAPAPPAGAPPTGNATAEAVFNPLGLPQPTFIPAFTERGFAVVPTPPALHEHMAIFLRDNLGSAAQEPPNWKRKAEYNIIPRRNAEDPDSNLTSRMVELSEDDKTWILREFQPLVVRRPSDLDPCKLSALIFSGPLRRPLIFSG